MARPYQAGVVLLRLFTIVDGIVLPVYFRTERSGQGPACGSLSQPEGLCVAAQLRPRGAPGGPRRRRKKFWVYFIRNQADRYKLEGEEGGARRPLVPYPPGQLRREKAQAVQQQLPPQAASWAALCATS